MIECLFIDKELGKVVRKYVSALIEEGRISPKQDLVVTDDEEYRVKMSEQRVLLLTDKRDPSSSVCSLTLPCRREALAEAILHCLTS